MPEWVDYYDEEPLEGIVVEQAPSHHVDYEPPIYNQPNLGRTDDEELERNLQQQVDAAVYGDSDDYMAMVDSDSEYVQLEEVGLVVDEALDEDQGGDVSNAGDMGVIPHNNEGDAANNDPVDDENPDDNYNPDNDYNLAAIVPVGGDGDQAELAIVAGDENPEYESFQIFFLILLNFFFFFLLFSLIFINFQFPLSHPVRDRTLGCAGLL